MAIQMRCVQCQERWVTTGPAGAICPVCRLEQARANSPTRRSQPLVYWPAIAVAVVFAIAIVLGTIGIVSFRAASSRTMQVTEARIARNLPAIRVEKPETAPVKMLVTQKEPQRPLLAPAPHLKPEGPPEKIVAEAIPEKPAPAVQPMAKPFVRRRPAPPTDELLRELWKVKEVDVTKMPMWRFDLMAHATKHKEQFPHPLPATFERPELAGLPFRKGYDCLTPAESAKTLEVLSRKLRTYMAEIVNEEARNRPAVPDSRVDPDALHTKLLLDRPGSWLKAESVPTLLQLLQSDDRSMRALLIDLLSQIEGPEATKALARRAVFDVNPTVREAAVNALRGRRTDDLLPILLDGLRYPWAPAADFAAEALVNLQVSEAISTLVPMLDAPEPSVAITKTKFGEMCVSRDLVRVNHLKNCMLCHAVSTATSDPVRGRIPVQGQALPPSFTPQYYNDPSPGAFVRADVTYLQQDFAVQQYVANSGPWPKHQRFDYLVQTRPLSINDPRHEKTAKDYPQRGAVLFALRQLTNQDFGDDSAGWKQWLHDARVGR